MNGGSQHEGFATESVGEVRLMQPTGSAIGLPDSMIIGKRELTREQAAERTLSKIDKIATGGDLRQLFRATAATFRVGRPDAAGPLLKRIIGAEAQEVLQAITKDVPAEAKDDLFRAYSEAAVARTTPAKPKVTVRTDEPKRDNPLKKGPTPRNGPRNKRLQIQDPKAKKLVADARPHREEGEKLFKKIYAGGLAKADPSDIDQAIRKYEYALELYEKAFIIEDNDAVYALLTGCSKQLFRLRFWKEQVGSK